MSSTAKGCLIAFAVVAVLAALAVVSVVFVLGRAADDVVTEFEEFGEELDENTGLADPSDYDVELTDCLPETGLVTAEGELTNTSDRDRAFWVNTAFTADGVRLGTANTYVEGLGQGNSAAWRATFFDVLPDDVQPSDVVCEVESVEYAF